MHRDLTERKRAEREAHRLSERMAEIGRIVSSSLDIEEIFERFAEEAAGLMNFDKVCIVLIDAESQTLSHAHATGAAPEEWERGRELPLAGTMAEQVLLTRSELLVQVGKRQELQERFPADAAAYDTGIRSFLLVPLVSDNNIVGALQFRSAQVDAYSDREVSVACQIGAQIAGAIANAELYRQRRQAEEAFKSSAHESSVIAELGRIVSSSLEIGEIYEPFAAQVRRLIQFDRLDITALDLDEGTFTSLFYTGRDIPSRRKGAVAPLGGSLTQAVAQGRKALIAQGMSERDLAQRYPLLGPAFRVGLRSFISAPLISRDRVVGVIQLLSTAENAYTVSDVDLMERVGAQIVGAMSNAQLHAEVERYADELDALAKIGSLVSSTPDITSIYGRFAEQVRRLIDFEFSTKPVPLTLVNIALARITMKH